MGGQHYVSFNSSSGVDTWSTSIRSTMNVWEHHVITVPPPMTGTWNYTNGRGVEIRIGLMRSGNVVQANSGQWFHGGSGYNGFADAHSDWAFNTAHSAYLTGVQLEIGSQATPFEHRPFGEELLLCQRYFETINLYGANTSFTGGGYNKHIGEVFWKVEKRTTPTTNTPSVSNYQPGGGTGTVTIGGATINGGTLNSGNTNQTYPDGWINSGSILTVDAEL
jgi:hypothetical protein